MIKTFLRSLWDDLTSALPTDFVDGDTGIVPARPPSIEHLSELADFDVELASIKEQAEVGARVVPHLSIAGGVWFCTGWLHCDYRVGTGNDQDAAYDNWLFGRKR